MPRVCPRCNGSYNDRWLCPTCNVRLVSTGSLIYELSSTPFPEIETSWQQTTVGRTVVGLLLAQGLYYGLWQLCTAVVMAFKDDAVINAWTASPPTGWVWWVMQALQAVGLLVGGLMAGAGQRRGVVLGLVLGLINGLIFLTMQVVIGQQRQGEGMILTAQEVVGQASFQVLCGALGGFLGSMIWKPISPIIGPGADTPVPPTRRTTLGGVRRMLRPFSGPIAWPRVAAGIAIAITGTVWAQMILNYMISTLNTRRVAPSPSQMAHPWFVTWEFSLLALLVGATVSGSNAKNGAKQGILVGLATSFALLFLWSEDVIKEVPQIILFKYFILRELTADNVSLVLLTVGFVTLLGLIGGWFGSQLLPPLLRPPKRRRPYAVGV